MVELKEKRLRKSHSEAKKEWQGQKDLNPRHAVLEDISEHRKPHRYADFKQKTEHQYPRKTVIDALLMMLDLFINR